MTKAEKLIEHPEVVEQRKLLIKAIEAGGIKIVENGNYMRPCPNCGGKDVSVYRWDILQDANGLTLQRTENSKHRDAFNNKTSWWRKILGYS